MRTLSKVVSLRILNKNKNDLLSFQTRAHDAPSVLARLTPLHKHTHKQTRTHAHTCIYAIHHRRLRIVNHIDPYRGYLHINTGC